MFDIYDPENNRLAIDVHFIEETALSFLRKMLSIRCAERQIALAKKNNLIGGPVHLGIGQEAIVGVAAELRASDRVFGAIQISCHILAMNFNVKALFAEILGRKTGFSKGMGGSMHLGWDQPSGFYGSVPIVSGTVPLALGAGLAAKLQKTGDVAIAYLATGQWKKV